MLTEAFIASVGVQSNAQRTDAGRDATILVIEHQPVVQAKATYKKSVTAKHCLAASRTHIFTVQQEKAVIHVYSRDKGSQEATVPFPEKITCITLTCADAVLVLGTCEGRLFVWETASGRLITTTQAHLQAVSALVVDSTSNYLVSISSDSTAQVWSLPQLLSFETDVDARSPLLAFDAHRSAIVDIVLGHSNTHQNFAVTISEDRSCLVWNYHTATILATFLLSASPVAIGLDAADRAIYVGYGDGSLQQLDIYDLCSVKPNSNAQHTIQPGDKGKWSMTDASHGVLSSLIVSTDSTIVLTGHQSGAILSWDVASGHARALALHPPIPGPVTNLLLCPTDFPHQGQATTSLSLPIVVKPKSSLAGTEYGGIPLNYTMQLQLSSSRAHSDSRFQQTLTSPLIPTELLESGLTELAQRSKGLASGTNGSSDEPSDDFMALDSESAEAQTDLARENSELKRQLQSLRQVQTATFDRMDRLAAERKALLRREEKRLLQAQNNHPIRGHTSSEGEGSD